jgi:hypothetical protein
MRMLLVILGIATAAFVLDDTPPQDLMLIF